MRAPRSLGTILLLALALVLVGVLVFQAQDAARSQQRIAEATLNDYASFADWQLTQQAKSSVLSSVITSLSAQASRVDPRRLAETMLSPEQAEAAAREITEPWCQCLGGVQYFFRYDWADGTFRTTANELPDPALAWARDTVASYAKSLPPISGPQPTTFGSPDAAFGALRPLNVVVTSDSYGMIVADTTRAHVPGEASVPQLLVFVVVREPSAGHPVVIYGYATDPRTYLGPTLRLIHQRNALLPPSLLKNTTPDSILAISVSTIEGREIYRSPAYFPSRYRAADTLEPRFGRLVMHVGLRPELASQLIVGGLPRSRLPLLGGVFVLTAGLLAVALRQLYRQQELARLRTEFVSGVSHELRTPLAQIRWFAELLHLGKLRSDEERSRSAGIIDQEARRLTYLVENVLNFSRAEKGTNRVTPEPLDLDAEIRDAVEMFTPLARSRRMTLRAAPAGLTVTADRNALRQILLNLLDNAAKYGPAGQTVTVGSQPSPAMAGSRVRIWVEDEGPGIPPGDRVRVWEPYVRLNRAAESATGGSGIGLSVVRELVALQHGATWIEAAGVGGGARVVVELPSRAGAEVAAGPVPEHEHAPVASEP
ncbi:MAG TPA: HAMP domain-containing sensor histidine kinase [Gemmatimonadaceae bacterium]|nr:HAMP domain-containing sensor histidine kinase [Gemmatimonadaceae bacterium]